MPGDFLLSNGGLFVASVLVGLVVGALCLAALRRRPNPARNPTLNIVIASGGVLLGGGLFGGCAMFLGAGNPPVAAPLPCPGLNGTPAVGFSGGGCPTPTATGAAQIIIVTDVPRIQTLTPSVPPPPARTPVPSLPPNTVTPTPTLTLVVRPTQTIVLVSLCEKILAPTFNANSSVFPASININFNFFKLFDKKYGSTKI